MNRRGFTIIEIAVAAMLLGALMIVSLEMLGATTVQRREADRRRLALIEVGNVLERLAARPWGELTPESAADVQLPDYILQRLPGAKLKIEIVASPPEETPAYKRITVGISWPDRAGRMLPPVSITTWRYKRLEQSGTPLSVSEGRGETGNTTPFATLRGVPPDRHYPLI